MYVRTCEWVSGEVVMVGCGEWVGGETAGVRVGKGG